MPGPAPRPTHLKLVKGNPGKRALNKREPKVQPGIPDAPDGMSERARSVWAVVAPKLVAYGVLTELDGYALEQCCEAYAHLRDCREALWARQALAYETVSEGGVMHRPFPEIRMVADADRRFRGWLTEFGMTPSARSKVSVMAPEPDDPEKEFFG